MNDFEMLLDQVFQEVPVLEGQIREEGYEGLYRDGRIYLDNRLLTTRKKERLIEEYCHHKTSVGDIIDYDNSESRKQEATARRLALETLIPLDKLVECAFAGCRGKYECAEYLDVEPSTLAAAINHYAAKYGQTYLYKNCILHFDNETIRIIKTMK